MSLAVVSLTLLCLAAEPQCPTDVKSCLNKLVPDGISETGDKASSCNSSSWKMYDYCYTEACPIRLVITDPPELRTWMCATDNKFEPYNPDAHIDLYHKFNNKVFDILPVGNQATYDRRGCKDSDFSAGGKDFNGKIAMIQRGTCVYSAKIRAAQTAGASIAIVYDYYLYYYHRAMGGDSTGHTIPALHVARHMGEVVVKAAESGKAVKGKIEFNCDRTPSYSFDQGADYPWDGCPSNRMALVKHCSTVENDKQERLCDKCPLEMQLPGAETLCFFGNSLRPRKRETLFHLTTPLPYNSPADEVVFASELPGRGCLASDFAELRGKMVIIPETGRCTLVSSVILAQEAGVKAYMMVTSTYFLQWHSIRAYSHFVTIPVHTTDYHAHGKLTVFGQAKGTYKAGIGYVFPAVLFQEGAYPATDPPTPAPTDEPEVSNILELDTSADFEWKTGTIICLVVIILDTLLLVGIFVKQQRDRVVLPEEAVPEGVSIPLGLALMGVSLTLLILIAVVTFTLTHAAGKDSTDKALESGRFAIDVTHANLGKNTVELADQIRGTVLATVTRALTDEVRQIEYKLKVVQNTFYGFNESFQSFSERFLPVARLVRNQDSTIDKLRFQVFTTRGFYMNYRYMTDDRDDAARNDGVVGPVQQTQAGWLYGYNHYEQNLVDRVFYIGGHTQNYEANASRMLGSNYGDPLSVTVGKPANHVQWMPSKVTFPFPFHRFTTMMSAFVPLGNEGTYMGTIEAHIDLHEFVNSALATQTSKNLENMTLLILDREDRTIFGSQGSGAAATRNEGKVYTRSETTTEYVHMYSLYTTITSPSVIVKAFDEYMTSRGGWDEDKEITGEFDQKEYFTHQDHLMLTDITAEGGKAKDTGSHGWDVEMRDGACGNCVAHDAQVGKDVLEFDGSTTLHLYRNFTKNTEIVKRHTTSTSPYMNSMRAYQEVHTFPDGSECIAHTTRTSLTTSTTRCLLRDDIFVGGYFAINMRINPSVVYDETSPGASTPRLLSDTLVGEANVRLFANGQLYLGIFTYGCRTKAIEGGLPINSWTTLTAVLKRGSDRKNFCRVYLNGTQYSEGRSSKNEREIWNSALSRNHAEPIRVGQHFRGRIDALQLFWMHLTNREIRALHTERKLVRTVHPKVRYVETQNLNLNGQETRGNLRAGVSWLVAAMIPRQDIMGIVDKNNAEAKQNLDTQEANTNKEVKQKANATIMIIVAMAMSSVVIFLVFNDLITKPFEQTALLMAEAAVMNIDTMPKTKSFVRELQTMNQAMVLLLSNLQMYKKFLPGALFEEKEQDIVRNSRPPPGITSGTATVVFTDIRSSTSIWEAVPQGMCEALKIHNRIIREAMDEFEGYEVKTIGDAFMVAFATVLDGVNFGLRVHEALRNATWPAELLHFRLCADTSPLWGGLTVRIGVNDGPVSVEKNTLTGRTDYFGHTVNVASRLESTCKPGAVGLRHELWKSCSVVCDGTVGAVQEIELKGVSGKTPVCYVWPVSLAGRVTNPLVERGAVPTGSGSFAGSGSERSISSSNMSALSLPGSVSTSGCLATVGVVQVAVGDEAHVSAMRIMSTHLMTLKSCLDRSGGRMVSLIGSFVSIAWNLSHAAPAHVENSLRFVQFLYGTSAIRGGGLVTGSVHHGEVGARTLRFVTVMGDAVQKSLMLCIEAKKEGLFFLYEPPVDTVLPQNLERVLTPHRAGVYVVQQKRDKAAPSNLVENF